MTNIPTDLLRTLVAVVDLRSFTKAAASLGLTQPAVSAQIKRLQFLLGGDLFDRSVQGISLTAHGEMVVSYARRLLSINDQIVHLGAISPKAELIIRVGSSSDYLASILPVALARFKEHSADVRFVVRTEAYEPLMRQLRSGEIDIVVGLSGNPPPDALHHWVEEMVWVRGSKSCLDDEQPVPLVTYGEPCAYHRLAVAALRSAGLQFEEVFTGPSITSLSGAVIAGLGVMAISRRAAADTGLASWDDGPLPPLPDLHCGVYVREGGTRSAYEQMADEIASVLRPGTAYGQPKLVAAGARAAGSAA